MSALSILGANLIADVQAPLTPKTGGNSTGNPAAGAGAAAEPDAADTSPVTAGDKVAAATLTILVTVGISGLVIFIMSP